MKLALIFVWIFLSVAVALWADKKGRSFELFLNLSLLFTPVVGLITILAVPATRKARFEEGQLRRCRGCAQLISSGHSTCPHCGRTQTGDGIRVKGESQSWLWLAGIALGVVILFAFLGSIGWAVNWILGPGI